jgi:hypothetical protein
VVAYAGGGGRGGGLDVEALVRLEGLCVSLLLFNFEFYFYNCWFLSLIFSPLFSQPIVVGSLLLYRGSINKVRLYFTNYPTNLEPYDPSPTSGGGSVLPLLYWRLVILNLFL